MRVRLLTALAVALLALWAPTAALAQGAGDDQYTDPFGSDPGSSGSGSQGSSGGGSSGSSGTSAGSGAPGGTARPPAASGTPVPSSASAAAPQLPYTGPGVETALVAAAGTLLLAGG